MRRKDQELLDPQRQRKCLCSSLPIQLDSANLQDMEWKQYITADPAVLAGKPVIAGTRLSVEFILELIAEGWSEAEILNNYPGITHQQILACVAYAKDRLSEESVFALPA